MKTSKKLTIMGLSAATALVAATGAVSSFAWFAVNGSVTATGMSIKAASADAYLQIKDSSAAWNTTDNFTAVNYQLGTVELKPTALVSEIAEDKKSITPYDGGTTHKWVYNTSSSIDSADATGDYSDVTKEGDTIERPTSSSNETVYKPKTNLYTLIYEFDIRLKYIETQKDTEKDVNATVSFPSATGNGALANAVSVVMFAGTVESESVDSQKAKGYVFTNSIGKWTDSTTIITGLKASNSDNKGTRIRFCAFFNGQDASCKTTNVVTDASYSLSVKFSLENHQTVSNKTSLV